ncbi:MAG: hypothetical protein LLF92_11515 [Planctomycetaceae bacterium]|nr:hypothetical protein [Planctomycetaceae bacterium]
MKFFIYISIIFLQAQYAYSKIELDHQLCESVINAKTLTIEVISVNNALTSDKIIKDAINYFKPYITGEIKILDCNNIKLNLGDDNAISRKQIDEIASSKKHNPTWITIIVCPSMDFLQRKGFFNYTALKDKPELCQQFIAINKQICDAHAASIPFVSSEQLTSLVILHELCHSLRVPARKEHMIKGNAGHCSNPNCILYPKIDFISSMSAILHLGPPKKLCKMCQEEVFAVQKTENINKN